MTPSPAANHVRQIEIENIFESSCESRKKMETKTKNAQTSTNRESNYPGLEKTNWERGVERAFLESSIIDEAAPIGSFSDLWRIFGIWGEDC